MADLGFVAAAYGLTWVVLAGYALSLEVRRRGAADELRRAAEAGPRSAGVEPWIAQGSVSPERGTNVDEP